MNAYSGLSAATEMLIASPKSPTGVAPSAPAGPTPRLGHITAGSVRPLQSSDDPADVVLVVYGTPGPQGSKKAVGTRVSRKTGKAVTVLAESSKKVEPWRAAVANAAAGLTPLDGALEVQMVFTVKPPQRMPTGRIYPTCYPDTSKLIRSTEDALTGRAWIDDAQVVRYRDTGKYYPGQHPDALDSPGAVIRVWTIGGAT